VSIKKLVAAEIITERPRFIEVDPADLYVDERYQRDVSARGLRLIRKIVQNWNWSELKPPVVVEVFEPLRVTGISESGYHVIDGQHTAIGAVTHNALTSSGFKSAIGKIPVMVVSADSVEARSRAFLGQNTSRVGITKLQLFRAAVAAGDEDALTATQVCDRFRRTRDHGGDRNHHAGEAPGCDGGAPDRPGHRRCQGGADHGATSSCRRAPDP
jgi:hypothetical protein